MVLPCINQNHCIIKETSTELNLTQFSAVSPLLVTHIQKLGKCHAWMTTLEAPSSLFIPLFPPINTSSPTNFHFKGTRDSILWLGQKTGYTAHGKPVKCSCCISADEKSHKWFHQPEFQRPENLQMHWRTIISRKCLNLSHFGMPAEVYRKY